MHGGCARSTTLPRWSLTSLTSSAATSRRRHTIGLIRIHLESIRNSDDPELAPATARISHLFETADSRLAGIHREFEFTFADAITPGGKHAANSRDAAQYQACQGAEVKEIIAAYSENPENDWNSANYPTLSALRSLTRKLPLKRCLRRERML